MLDMQSLHYLINGIITGTVVSAGILATYFTLYYRERREQKEH